MQLQQTRRNGGLAEGGSTVGVYLSERQLREQQTLANLEAYLDRIESDTPEHYFVGSEGDKCPIGAFMQDMFKRRNLMAPGLQVCARTVSYSVCYKSPGEYYSAFELDLSFEPAFAALSLWAANHSHISIADVRNAIAAYNRGETTLPDPEDHERQYQVTVRRTRMVEIIEEAEITVTALNEDAATEQAEDNDPDYLAWDEVDNTEVDTSNMVVSYVEEV
jgi:hypothetical protein